MNVADEGSDPIAPTSWRAPATAFALSTALGFAMLAALAFWPVADAAKAQQAPDPLAALKARYARPAFVPSPGDNPPSPAKIALGQRIFADPELPAPSPAPPVTTPGSASRMASPRARASPTVASPGDAQALTRSETAGFAIFNGKGRCGNCHAGFAFTDHNFYGIGLPGADKGRGWSSRWRTPRHTHSRTPTPRRRRSGILPRPPLDAPHRW